MSLTVLIAAIIVLFFWFRVQMAEGYRELTYEAMANTDTVFSGRLTDAKNRITEWYTSPDGICLRLKENTPFTEHMSFINKILSTLNGNSFMQSVCFVNTGKSISLTVGSNVSHPEDLEESLLRQLENVENGNRTFFWNAKDSFSDDMIPIMSVSMAENAMGDLRFSGMSVINIDLRQFNKSLFSGRKPGQFRLIVLNREGVVVCNSDLTNLGEDWSQKEWVQRILGGETQFDVREENLLNYDQFQGDSGGSVRRGWFLYGSAVGVRGTDCQCKIYPLYGSCGNSCSGGDNSYHDDAGIPENFSAFSYNGR